MLKKSLSLICILPLIFFCVTLYGQTQGEITGEVTDASGAVIPNVKVTVTNQNTNAVRDTVTNNAGQYDFPALLPGTYSIKAEAQGFQTMMRNNIELQVQQVVRSDFHMQLGQVTQTVTVSTAAPLLDTESSTVGTVIGTNRIEDLPLNGRDFLQLVALSPNVVYGFAPSSQGSTIQGGQRAATTISVAGQRAEFNYYSLDGIDDTDDNWNAYLLLPSVDALQEFKVQYGIYPAQYGRNVGQINVSTKSGTNSYHGALWDFVRNSVMDADNYAFTTAAALKSPLNRNQFGYTLGGPVIIPKLFNGKDKLFFMTNYEGQRWYTSLQEVATVPTLAQRGQAPGDPYADFSGPGLNPIYDPATRPADGSTATQFPGNQIPQNRIDQNALKLLAYYPAPNVIGQIGPTGAPINNYQILNSEVQNADQFTVRIDFDRSAKSTWFGRYSWSNEEDLTPTTFPDQGNVLTTVVHQSEIGNTRVLTPTIVNQFLFGYSGLANILVTQGAYGPNIEGSLGITGLAIPTPITYGIPDVGPTGYAGWGEGSTAPNVSNDHIFEAIDNVSITRGKHTFQFGAQIRRDEYNQEGNQQTDGDFGFTGQATENPQAVSTTGDGFADYMLGLVSNSSGPVVPLAVAQLRATEQYYYAEDTWKISRNLTITPGLRYELSPPYWAKHDEMMNTQLNSIPQTADFSTYNPANPPVIVREGTANNFYEGIPWTFAPGIVTAQDGRMGKYLVDDDRTMFAPRLGLAWTPGTKWTVRSGIGRFYAMHIGNVVYDMSRNLAVRRSVAANTLVPNLTFENPFDLPPGSSALTVATPTILSNFQTARPAYEIQYELNVQRELTTNAALEVGYLGSEGHHLMRFLNFNAPLPGPGNTQSRRPDPNLALIQENGKDYVNSTYNSLEAKYTQRMSHGVNALVGYTYSRSIDDGSAIRSHGGDEDFAQNPYSYGAAGGERGPSNFNQTHRLVTSLLYEPPIGRGKAFLNHGVLSEVFGDWQFNEIFTLASGSPYTFSYTANILNGGGGSSSGTGGRPNFSGQTLDPTGGKNWHHWFNINGYVNPPLYAFGDVGRNSAYGPSLLSWDSSVMKMFPAYREQELQFRFEAFNAPNHPNFGLPSATLGSSTFGTISSTSVPMRELQLSLKYIF